MISQKDLIPGSQEALIAKVKMSPPLMLGDVDFKFDLSYDIDELYVEKARKFIRETPENVAEGLNTLRELLKGEPNLNTPYTDDFLYKFLRPCKWYPKSAFELIKRFYKFRITYPQYYTDLYPSHEEDIYGAGILTPLPCRCSNGERILLMQAGKKWNPKKITLVQIFRGLILSLEAAITEPKTQISGVHVIFDMEGLTLTQVTYYTPSFARAVLEWVQRSLPCRVRGIHIINQPYIFNMVFAIFKPFIQEKLRNRIHFHGTNKASFYEFIEPKILPIQYGGQLNMTNETGGINFWKYLCMFDEDFKESMKYGYSTKP